MKQELDYSVKSLDLLASYDQNSSCWKTSQTSFLDQLNLKEAGSLQFSLNWSRSGMMQNGTAYRLPTLAAGQGGTEYGYLPTPTTSTSKGAVKNRYLGSPTYRGNLHEWLRSSQADPIYPHPCFLEKVMQYPTGWTEL